MFPLTKFSAIMSVISCLPSSPWPPWASQHIEDHFYLPRQVRKVISCHNITGVIANKLCQCTKGLGGWPHSRSSLFVSRHPWLQRLWHNRDPCSSAVIVKYCGLHYCSVNCRIIVHRPLDEIQLIPCSSNVICFPI